MTQIITIKNRYAFSAILDKIQKELVITKI
jgi:hypothetical protein